MPTDHSAHGREEAELLRETTLASGMDPRLSPDDLGVCLDSPDQLLARLGPCSGDRPATERDVRRTSRLAVLASTAVAATVALLRRQR